jgi:hypothetical protein
MRCIGTRTEDEYLVTSPFIHDSDVGYLYSVGAGDGCDIKKRIIRPDGVQRVIRCVGMPVREGAACQ